MRLSLACSALAVVACTGAPPPAPPAVLPAVSVAAPPPPRVDVGAPPEPPMAVRWTFRQPSVAGRPWSTRHFEVREDGQGIWEDEAGEGDGDVAEDLSAGPVPPPVRHRCERRLGPELHRRLVEAARKAMAAGCTAHAPRLDAATTTLAVTWEGAISSCALPGSGGSFLAFERLRTEAVVALCGR